jgi:hypothetical protein
MEVQIAIAKFNKYAVSESADRTLQNMTHPEINLSWVSFFLNRTYAVQNLLPRITRIITNFLNNSRELAKFAACS